MRRVALFALLGVAAQSAVVQAAPIEAPPDLSELEPPRILAAVDPRYPEEAQKAGIEGTVHLRLTLNAEGAVEGVEVVSGPELLRLPAAQAVGVFRFEPARYHGEPVAVVLDYMMTFTLQQHESAMNAMLLGRVTSGSGDPLVDARVEFFDSDRVALTDVDGRFAFEEMRPDSYLLMVSARGFAPKRRYVYIGEDEAVSVSVVLWTRKEATYETVVMARRGRPEVDRHPLELDVTPTVSHHRLTRRDIELTPGSLEDVSRTVQSLPGVVGEPGLLATFFVRGGDSDDVLYYLDGMPIENPFHLGGFASLFNPELITQVDLFAGLQPAAYRSSLGGILDIRYADGDLDRTEAVADLSMNTFKAVASGPTGIEGMSFLFAARRSYFEAYFAMLQELGVVGRRFAAPDLGEYVGKVSYRAGAHTVHATALYATDGLNFIGDQDDASLVKFDGQLRLRNALTLASARWAYTPSDRFRLQTVAGFIRDRNETERRGGGDESAGALISSGDLLADTAVGRVDMTWRRAAGDTVRAGLELSWRRRRFAGRLSDTRFQPAWVALPLADYDLGTLDVAPESRRTEVGIYIEREMRDLVPRLTPVLGVRVEAAPGEGAQVAPRLAVAYRPLRGTAVKAGVSVSHQRTRDPLVDHFSPDVRPERALHGVLALEQLLPWKALLRVEGYGKSLSSLIVATDSPATLGSAPVFTNDGEGWAYGVDVLLQRRGDILGLGLSYGWLQSERTNPRHELFERSYVPLQQQSHTLGLTADARLGDAWVVSTRYQFHTGRPYTPISGWRLAEGEEGPRWVPIVGRPGGEQGRRRLNDVWTEPFHELSIRVEYWLRFASWRMTAYAEVLNVTNSTSTFVPTYDTGDPSRFQLPVRGSIDTLPIRPFLGVRAEY